MSPQGSGVSVTDPLMPLRPVQRPRVWVTRAPEDAQAWVRGLNESGLDAQSLPLMAIGPAPNLQPLHTAWQHLADYHAVMFVSANAVRYFFQARPPSCSVQTSARLWVTGPGSRAALLQAGVADVQIDAPPALSPQWDSEALWAVVASQAQAGQRVLLVRGADAHGQATGRDWLSHQLQAAGVQVAQVAAYQRQTPALNDDQRLAAVQAASDGAVWLFSNSEAIGHLTAALPEQDWSQALAVATHPRIAHTARQAGWGHVTVTQPAMVAVASSIKSLYEFRNPPA